MNMNFTFLGMALVLPLIAGAQTPAQQDPAQALQRQTKTTLHKTPAREQSDWVFKVSADDIIYDQPAGDFKITQKSGDYYTMSMFGIGQSYANGIPCRVVEAENGDYYIYNPFTGLNTASWLRGHVEGDKLTIDLPQAIYQDGEEGNQYVYVAQMCHFEADPSDPESDRYYYNDGATQMVFERDGDTWKSTAETYNDHPVIMGLVAADDGTWCAYSDWNTIIAPFNDKVIDVPASLSTESYEVISKSEGKYVSGNYMKVGFDGNDVYMQGLFSALPDVWVKGTLDGNKVTVPSVQYLGFDEMSNYFGYFVSAHQEEYTDPDYGYSYMIYKPTDALILTYDAENKIFTTDEMDAAINNRGKEEVYSISQHDNPRISITRPVTDFTPMDPTLGYCADYNADYGYGSIYFDFPMLNKDLQILDPENLYYEMFVDGDIHTFYSDVYEGLPSEELDQVPFTFTNRNGLGYYGTGGVTHFINYYFQGAESIALRTLYKNGDETKYSNLVYVFNHSGVTAVDANEVSSVEYFDLTGAKVNNPAKGLYIKVTTATDGTRRSEKVMFTR